MQTQAMTNKIYTADRDRDFHFRVKDPGSATTHFIGFVAAVLMTPVLLVHAAGNGADFMTMIGMSVFYDQHDSSLWCKYILSFIRHFRKRRICV